jgi:hypothetical protein
MGKMGHVQQFLCAEHLEKGLDLLFDYLGGSERLAIEIEVCSCPSWVHTARWHEFGDGVGFKLHLLCDPSISENTSCHLRMNWVSRAPVPARYTVMVPFVQEIPAFEHPGVPTIPWENLFDRRTRIAGKCSGRDLRGLLESYCVPVLFLPAPEKWEETRPELLLQLALFAAQRGYLRTNDTRIAKAFMDYGAQFLRDGNNEELSANLKDILGRVFERFFMRGQCGKGFMSPYQGYNSSKQAFSFVSYMRKAIRGEAVNARKRSSDVQVANMDVFATRTEGSRGRGTRKADHEANAPGSRRPRSDEEADKIWGASRRTIARRLRDKTASGWTEETGQQIYQELKKEQQLRAVWQEIIRIRQVNGSSQEAARKWVTRAKRKGLDPRMVLAGLSSTKELPRKLCDFCGDPARVAFQNRCLCIECYHEKNPAATL